ncbi:hypothetical protein SAMN05216516_103273 [Izhakiella capsodis]|uniref:Uncharacterized protein n=1 Tax=Izhakiella capsodis TaxID=1367852 RepID=A0A1I4X4U1_9GAMM|nr:hypothetical protein [Izhakiella capsodis]SFN20426.1 hypothetical protein SAMN05216516_103273 [Izhakiella capsodis]
MKIVSNLRAIIFKRSYGSFDLAGKNPKKSDVAKNIDSVIQANGIRFLNVPHSDSKAANSTRVDASIGLPVLKTLRSNIHRLNLFSSYSNKGEGEITKIDERLI